MSKGPKEQGTIRTKFYRQDVLVCILGGSLNPTHDGVSGVTLRMNDRNGMVLATGIKLERDGSGFRIDTECLGAISANLRKVNIRLPGEEFDRFIHTLNLAFFNMQPGNFSSM
ncbi:hypothetical protein HYV31_01435 [candidate division WWE3 bacterium]|nr:hypothetical protein [candidate division WWE3 bacterium]